ncbi:MAG: MFS transporter [Steroidobacteraceae bacterium]|nr:MFS transporter [Steroidobacteraceae bacterium]
MLQSLDWLMRNVLRAKAGEERAVGLAFLYFFMLLCAYYLLRPVRDAMAIGAGLQNLRWLFTGTFVSMLVLMPLFGALVSRVRKQLLLPVTYGFFASNLLVFYLLFRVIPDTFWLAAAFFIWLSVFNYFVVSVFWSFMADVFRDEEAKRLFGPISAGGGSGAIVGSFITQDIVPALGIDAVVGLAMLLLLGTLPCIRGLAAWAEARHGHFVLPPEDPESRIGGRVMAGLLLVARSPYLLGIFVIVSIGSITGLFMYNELLRLVGDAYPDAASRTQFFARLDMAVNILAWVFQGIVVSWLIRAVNLSGALVTIPIVALLTFIALPVAFVAAMPLLTVLAAGQVLRRAGEFGIAKPSREVLFTIVDAETKYKAKNFIDTVMQRGSDWVGIWLHVLLQSLGFGLLGFATLCGAAMVAAGVISFGLGRSFERRGAGTS